MANVTDLYYLAQNSNFNGPNIDFDIEYTELFGFIRCNKGYIPANLPSEIVNDIASNNKEYVKCVYKIKMNPVSAGNTLSVFYRCDFYNRQIKLTSVKFRDDIYYAGPGIMIDSHKDILFSVCYSPIGNKAIVVHPKVYRQKTAMSKYITQKIIPEFAKNGMEVIIKNNSIFSVRSGIYDRCIEKLQHISNDYKLCEMET